MKEKNIILAARILSMAFTPFYLSLVGLIALFTFSYLSLMPWAYKLTVLLLVYAFTILMPSLLIHSIVITTVGRSLSWARRSVASYLISSP